MKYPPYPFALSAFASLVVAGGMTLSTLPAQAQAPTAEQLINHGPAKMDIFQLNAPKKVNAHTYEFVTPQQQKVTVDFYAPHIFRLYQDSIGKAMHTPIATPPADILVAQPRKEVGQLLFEEKGNSYIFTTSALIVDLDGRTGAMTLTDRRTGKIAVRTLGAPQFDAKGVQLNLASTDNEYFYGGGVQNGRFSTADSALPSKTPTTGWTAVWPHPRLSTGRRQATV